MMQNANGPAETATRQLPSHNPQAGLPVRERQVLTCPSELLSLLLKCLDRNANLRPTMLTVKAELKRMLSPDRYRTFRFPCQLSTEM
jgi:hypothetical protein